MFDKANIPEAEVVFLKNILHDWSDEDCGRILENVRGSLPAGSGGRVVIVESFVPNPGEVRRDDHHAFTKDFSMMVIGGRGRTEAQTRVMLEKTGFRLEQKMVWWVPLAGKMCCTVASKL